jgi:hypothetical protein
MPENTQVEYGLKELTEVMIRDQGITEGHWQILVRFSFAAATIDAPGEGPAPSVISRVQSIGLSRVDEPNMLSVDAASLHMPAANRAARRAVKTR